MSGVSDQVIEDGVFEELKPACVALVAIAPQVQFLPKLPLPRPDPTFVTHLIASAAGVKLSWRFAQKLIDRRWPRHRGHCSAAAMQ